MKSIGSWLAMVTLALTLLAGMMPVQAASMPSLSATAAVSDVQGHWAEKTLTEWLDKGWISGYGNGAVKPNQAVTRAELAAMINQAFGLQGDGQQTEFSDLPASHWARYVIGTAVEQGYMKGTGNHKVSPNRVATRQEAAVMLAALVRGERLAQPALNQPFYRDGDQLAGWSRSSVALLLARGVMQGDASGNFRPSDPLTRAEAVVAIQKALAVPRARSIAEVWTIDQPGEYGGTAAERRVVGDVVIRSSGVTLQHVQVEGALFITMNAASGKEDIILRDVHVPGVSIIEGSGASPIRLQDSVLGELNVGKTTAMVQLTASGNTAVEQTVLLSPASIEGLTSGDGGFQQVVVGFDFSVGGTIELKRHIGKLYIEARSASLIGKAAVIEEMVTEWFTSGSFMLDKETRVQHVKLYNGWSFTGEGRIGKAFIAQTAVRTEFAVQPDTLERETEEGCCPVMMLPAGQGGMSTTETTSLLDNLTVTGGELFRMENNQYAGTAFNSNVFEYEIAVQQGEYRSGIVKLNFTTVDPKATVTGYRAAWPDMKETNSRQLEIRMSDGENGDYVIKVQAGSDYHIYKFFVNNISFEEGTSMDTVPYTDKNTGRIVAEQPRLTTTAFNIGDELVIRYRGQEISACLKGLWAHHCVLPTQLQLPDEKIPLELEVTKPNGKVETHTYMYDRTPLPYYPMTDDLIVALKNKAELMEESAGMLSPYSFGYEFLWTTGEHRDFPEHSVRYKASSLLTAFGAAPEYRVQRVQDAVTPATLIPEGNYMGYGSEEWVSSDGDLYDKLLYIYFYNEASKPIGYTVQLLQFDEDHVLGVKPIMNTRSKPH